MHEPHVESLCGWLRDFFSRRVDIALQDERRAIQPHVILALGRHGLFGISAPAEVGGLGLTNAASVTVYAQLGALDLATAGVVGQHNSLGLGPILRHGDAALREALLPDLIAGRRLAGFALTEDAAGSNPTAIEGELTAAEGGRWRLNASKRWVGNGGWASHLNVFARHRSAGGQLLGISACVVDCARQGVRLGPEHLTMGLRGNVQSRVSFEDVEVDTHALLGGPGAGLAVAIEAMQQTRLVVGALCEGAMLRCLDLWGRYARQRRVNTGLLLDNPVTRERLRESLIRWMVVHALNRVSAACLDEGKAPAELLMTTKIAASEHLWSVLDHAIQGLGGRGYTENNELPRIARDARVLRIFEGPSEVLEHFIGLRGASAALGRFLRERLGAPAVAERLENALEDLAELRGARAGPRAEMFAHAAGPLLRAALELAAYEHLPAAPLPALDGSARRWLLAAFTAEVERARERVHSADQVPPAALLDESLHALADRSPRGVEHAQIGVEWERDPLLAPRGVSAP